MIDRLTSSPVGSYTYGASGHLHAVTAIGSAYTASYDAAGNMTCRAPSSSATCSGTQTGAQLTYDNEGRLTAWQNAPTNPSSTTSNLYDGEGQRVEQQVASGGSGTTTVYVGNIEEISSSSGATITTTSYDAGGQRLAQAVNGTFSYLGSDGLGSAEVALDGSGTAQASILYDPYGNVRYSNGAMPGSYGFTGQRADGATGLDDYGARYYDPVAGQFVAADTVNDGLSRYGYVGGNPETLSDPSGHIMVAGDGGAGVCTSNCSPTSSGGGSTTPPTLKNPIAPTGGSDTGILNPLQSGCDQECQRTRALTNLDADAQEHILAAVLLQALSVITIILSGSQTLAILEGIADLLDLLELALPSIGKLALDKGLGPDLYTNFQRATAGLEELAGLIQDAIGWYKTAGWVMQTMINVAVFTGRTTAEGAEGAILDLGEQALGGAASLLLNGFADQQFALANADLAQENAQGHMDINAWCRQYGNGCPT